VDELKGLLEEAEVVASADIERDVVTMNSRVCLEDLESHEKSILTVVYPEDSGPETGKVSVLAPIGMAVLGRRPGDEIRRGVPGGVRRLKLLKILYQPEAAGNYAL
jgi:regulator of nucleoside diphosphate kinase